MTIRKLPSISSMTVVVATDTVLMSTLRRQCCKAVLTAYRKDLGRMIGAAVLVANNLAMLDVDDPPAKHVNHLAVVGCHQHSGASCIDLDQQLDDFPGGVGVEVACRLIGDDHPG